MKTQDLEQLVRANIRILCPYSTARDEYKGKLGIFLDANESPYPTGYNRYPDPHQLILKERISQIKGLPVENIFLGNGSDECIDLIFRVFCTPGKDNVVAMAPSYGMYAVAAQTNDIEVRDVMLGEDFSLPTEALLGRCDENTKAMFLCSPNNPSGNAFSNAMICEILERFNGIVVLDEAYADFSSIPSMTRRLQDYPNLVVFQTLSKAWGLAGLRLGLAFSNEYIIRLMSMVKYPYNINSSTQVLVLEALGNPIDEKVKTIKEERAMLAGKLPSFGFIKKVYPSEANFLLIKVDNADKLYNHLLSDGIIVRNRDKVAGCKGCLRITVGLPEENAKLLASLAGFQESE